MTAEKPTGELINRLDKVWWSKKSISKMGPLRKGGSSIQQASIREILGKNYVVEHDPASGKIKDVLGSHRETEGEGDGEIYHYRPFMAGLINWSELMKELQSKTEN